MHLQEIGPNRYFVLVDHSCNYNKEWKVENFISKWYNRSKFERIYALSIEPMNGFKYWPRIHKHKIKPPKKKKKLLGRPKKSMRLKKWELEGHNKSACPDNPKNKV